MDQTILQGIPDNKWGFSPNSYNFSATSVLKSDRYRKLDRRSQYFQCKQHDWKEVDFDGMMVGRSEYSPSFGQPFLAQAKVAHYVPLRRRRPSAPVRLGRTIVADFTKLVFGESRFPRMGVPGDKDAEEFVAGLVEAAKLSAIMVATRNNGGSAGVVGVSWGYVDGLPVVEVHEGKFLHVHEWADRAHWIPAHVSKVYQYQLAVLDPQTHKVVNKSYWYRRDWTTKADIHYLEVEAKSGAEPVWIIDETRSAIHNDDKCHLVWIQNTLADEPDGEPDYEGLYDKLDSLDVLNSVLVRGGINNLDPTLLLQMDPELVAGTMVRKGSDNALVTGKDGSASYMELAGTSLTTGDALIARLKQECLDEAECVHPDPDKVASAGLSSTAIKAIYAPMLNRAGIYRVLYGEPLRRLVNDMLLAARKHWEEVELVDEEELDEDGNGTGNIVQQARKVQRFVRLPPKVVEEEVIDPVTLEPTGEKTVKLVERNPGVSGEVELIWGEYFQPTADDLQKQMMAYASGTAGKAVVSRRVAVEKLSALIGTDPAAMLRDLEGDERASAAMDAARYGAAPLPDAADTETDPNAIVTPVDGAAPGAPAGEGAQPPKEIPSITLTSTDLGSIISVNEARAQYGLGPMLTAQGTPDPDGSLTLTEFKAKRSTVVATAAQAEKGQKPGEAPQGAQGAQGAPGGFGGKPPGNGAPFGKKPAEEAKEE